MKKTVLCLSLIVLLGAVSGFLYHRLGTTERKIASREEDSDTLLYVNERLQQQNRRLKREKQRLLSKLKRQRAVITAYRDAFTQAHMEWIRKRLAAVETASTPFTGMVVVAASAFDDAETYREDIRRMGRLETDLFGFSGEEEYGRGICGDDLNQTALKIRNDARKGIRTFLSVDGNDTDAVVSYWKGQINDGMASVTDGDDRLKLYTLTMYETLLEDLNVSADIRGALKETFKYWRYVFGL